MNGFPRHSYRNGRLRQDFKDEVFCFLKQLLWLDDSVNEPHL